MNIHKSKTIWFSAALAALGVLEINMGVVAESLGEHSGLVYVGIAAAMAALRVLTTEPLSEK